MTQGLADQLPGDLVVLLEDVGHRLGALCAVGHDWLLEGERADVTVLAGDAEVHAVIVLGGC